MHRSAPWDGSEGSYERDLCAWPPVGQLALSLHHGSYVRVPTRNGVELLFPGDWLVKSADGIGVGRA